MPSPLFGAASVAAVAAAAVTAGSAIDLDLRAQSFGLTLTAYLVLSWAIAIRSRRAAHELALEFSTPEPDLETLDELSTIFAGRLGTADAFRLAADRIRQVLDVERVIFYTLDDERRSVVGLHSDPGGSEDLRTIPYDLAQLALTKSEVAADKISAAIPLTNNGSVFAVLQLFFSAGTRSPGVGVLEAVGERLAPLLLGSVARENSRRNELTDAATDLPNERAFYIALENHTAEAQRVRGEMELTVLAIDIRGFNKINEDLGHAAGDKVLLAAGQVIRRELRQMDLVARALNDEFVVILPTAGKEISREIIARIREAFSQNDISIPGVSDLRIGLNVGWAAFGSDGESPTQLVSVAQLRKEQAKARSGGNVLWFPPTQRIIR